MIATYVSLLRKLLSCPAEIRVVVYMYLLLTPLIVRGLKASKCAAIAAQVRDAAREFVACPGPSSTARVREAIKDLERLPEA